METKPFSLQSPEAIAKEYGGNKQQIAQAMQMGLVDPTAAVLAGMFIDRMRSAQSLEQAPSQTVAQDVMAPPPQIPPQMGVPGQAMPQGQMGASQTATGLADLPVDPSMFNEASFANGGIVAFQTGGSTRFGRFIDRRMQAAEENQIRNRIASRIRGQTGLGGLFTPQSEMEFEGMKSLESALPNLNVQQLVELEKSLAQRDPALRTAPASQFYQPPAEIIAEQTKAAPGPQVDAARQGQGQVAPAAPTQPQMAIPTLPTQEAPNLAGLLAERQALLPKGQAYEVDEKELLADKEARKAEAQNSMWMRVAEMGFGMMASQSPYVAQAVGQAGTQALKGYADDLKDQKKLDREDRKFLADIRQARRAEERGDVDKASELYSKSLDRLSADDRARLQANTSLRVAEISAGAPGAEEKLIRSYATSKRISFDQAVQEIAAARAEGKDPFVGMFRDKFKDKVVSDENMDRLSKLMQKIADMSSNKP